MAISGQTPVFRQPEIYPPCRSALLTALRDNWQCPPVSLAEADVLAEETVKMERQLERNYRWLAYWRDVRCARILME